MTQLLSIPNEAQQVFLESRAAAKIVANESRKFWVTCVVLSFLGHGLLGS